MSTKNDQVISIGWQLAIEVNGNLITLIGINLKAISLKDLCHLVDEGLVWLKHVKLVNNSCLSLKVWARC